MKYIDVDPLLKEIKSLRNVDYETPKETRAFSDALSRILSFIDSLQQEEFTEVDFEKEIKEWREHGPHTSYPWCTIPDAIEITARHFYEFGKQSK